MNILWFAKITRALSSHWLLQGSGCSSSLENTVVREGDFFPCPNRSFIYCCLLLLSLPEHSALLISSSVLKVSKSTMVGAWALVGKSQSWSNFSFPSLSNAVRVFNIVKKKKCDKAGLMLPSPLEETPFRDTVCKAMAGERSQREHWCYNHHMTLMY